MRVMKDNKGITLIALIFTIIIVISLAGILVRNMLENEGTVEKAEISRDITEYKMAKERIEIKIGEIITKCHLEGKEFKIDEIIEAIENDDEIILEKFYNSKVASLKEGVTENLVNLEDIVVSVNKYYRFKFLIGQNAQIKGVTSGNVTESTPKNEFKTIEDFERILLMQKCIVKYSANGGEGTINSQEIKKGDKLIIARNTFTKEGQEFNGWSLNQNGEGQKYNEESEITVEDDMTLYAQWKDSILYIYKDGVENTTVTNGFGGIKYYGRETGSLTNNTKDKYLDFATTNAATIYYKGTKNTFDWRNYKTLNMICEPYGEQTWWGTYGGVGIGITTAAIDSSYNGGIPTTCSGYANGNQGTKMNKKITVTCTLSGTYTSNDRIFVYTHRASVRIYEIWLTK